MRVDIRCRAEIAVSEPLLNLLERDVVRQQERGAAVPQIVEANVPKPILLQHSPEVGGKIGGQDALPHLVQADVPVVLLVVGLAAEPPVFGLSLAQVQQQLAHRRDQRQRATAGF